MRVLVGFFMIGPSGGRWQLRGTWIGQNWTQLCTAYAWLAKLERTSFVHCAWVITILRTSVLRHGRVYFQPPVLVNTGLHQLAPFLNQGLFPGWQDLATLPPFHLDLHRYQCVGSLTSQRAQDAHLIHASMHMCVLYARGNMQGQSAGLGAGWLLLPKGPGCPESSDILHRDNKVVKTLTVLCLCRTLLSKLISRCYLYASCVCAGHHTCIVAGTVKFYYGYVKCMQTMSSIIMLATGMVYAWHCVPWVELRVQVMEWVEE